MISTDLIARIVREVIAEDARECEPNSGVGGFTPPRSGTKAPAPGVTPENVFGPWGQAPTTRNACRPPDRPPYAVDDPEDAAQLVKLVSLTLSIRTPHA